MDALTNNAQRRFAHSRRPRGSVQNVVSLTRGRLAAPCKTSFRSLGAASRGSGQTSFCHSIHSSSSYVRHRVFGAYALGYRGRSIVFRCRFFERSCDARSRRRCVFLSRYARCFRRSLTKRTPRHHISRRHPTRGGSSMNNRLHPLWIALAVAITAAPGCIFAARPRWQSTWNGV
jgi:hypothetical protein